MPSWRLWWLPSFLLPSSDSQRWWADDNFLQGERLLSPFPPTTPFPYSPPFYNLQPKKKKRKKKRAGQELFSSVPQKKRLSNKPPLSFPPSHPGGVFSKKLIPISIYVIVYNLRSEMERKLKKRGFFFWPLFSLHRLRMRKFTSFGGLS